MMYCRRQSRLATCFLIPFLLLLDGCVRNVIIDPVQTPQNYLKDFDENLRSHDTVALQFKSAVLDHTFSESGLLAIDPTTTWDIQAAQYLPEVLESVLSNYYKKVELQQSTHYQFNCQACGLYIRPSIINIDISKVTMQSFIDIKLDIFDSQGRKVVEILSNGSSELITLGRLGAGIGGFYIPLFSSLVGPQVVSDSIETALVDAIENAVDEMKYETQHGTLARTFLPKTVINKKRYGKYEYAAEKLARQKGCNFRTDGLELTESKYHVEQYKAYCWGVGVKSITCKYNQCSAQYH